MTSHPPEAKAGTGAWPGTPILQLRDATVEIDRARLVGGVSIDLMPGTVTGLIGANGAGKSTLLKVLARQQPMSSGDCQLKGREIASFGSREFSRHVGYLPQSIPPTQGLTVEEIIRMGRFPWHGVLGPFTEKDARAVADALRMTGMERFAGRFTDTLSGGERQRCWIAMLLAQEAGVLLLDEPVSALDLRYQTETMELIRRISRTRKISILVILHDINLAARFCDEVIALKRGERVWMGRAAELLDAETLEAIYDTPMIIVSRPGTNERFAFATLGT